jgi:hypothetical protein
MTNQSYFHGFSPSLSRISIYRETTLPQTGTNNGQLKMLGLGPYTPSKDAPNSFRITELSNEFFIPMGGPQAHANSLESRG